MKPTVTDSPVTTVRNPYPGLRPFRPDEKHLFFGREQQVDRMVVKLAAHHFLAVVGGSGSGKSSLVNCGLRPALHRGNMASAGAAWRMAQMRPGSDPLGALARALAAPGVLFDKPLTGAVSSEALVETTLRLGSLGLIDIVEQADLPAGTQVLVVADQFEELFRFRALVRGAHLDSFSPAEDAVAFVRLLLEASTQTEVPIYVVLTMRSDFLGECAQFQGLPEAINEGQYLVPRLTRNEIRAAVTGPAAVGRATLSPVLVTRLLNDVGDNPDQLSILQHALNRTWSKWETDGQASGPLEIGHYEAAGGMAKALDLHAEKAYGEFSDAPSRRLCEQIFKALTDAGTDPRGIRRPTSLATLGDITGNSTEQLLTVIDVFRRPSRSFLMPPMTDTLGPDSPIDVSHESLMRVWRRLKTWADEEAQSARIYRRLRETALEYEANSLRDPELRLVLDWREKNTPTPAWGEMYGGGFASAMTFLDKSRDEQNNEKLEAEIEARWRSTWSWVPIVVTAAVFVGLQLWLARELDTVFQDGNNLIVNSIKKANLQEVLPHLLAGMPAAVGYLLLAPYAKKRFARSEKRRHARARVITQGQASAVQAERKPAAQADVRALGYASFGQRALAQLVDWVLCLVPVVSLFNFAPDDDTGSMIFGVGTIAIFYLYHAAFWTSKHQGTIGMRLAGVSLADRQGRRLSWRRATLRFFARWLSYYTAGLGFLMQPFNKEGQALHDRLSGTVVLRRAPAAAQVDVHELRYASFGRRAAAQLVDWVLCLLVWSPAAALAGLGIGISEYTSYVIFFLIAFSYHVICWRSFRQATFGMMLAGICVTDLERHRLSRNRAIGRFFARWLSYITAGIGFLMQPFNKERQALHDRLSGTVVLRGEPNAAPQR
jgi:uncharacterized RDD family membrane protein YckC/energy-coupling factor transporter ATP-binding protein EcfA2